MAADVGAILSVVAPDVHRLGAPGVCAEVAGTGAILGASWPGAGQLPEQCRERCRLFLDGARDCLGPGARDRSGRQAVRRRWASTGLRMRNRGDRRCGRANRDHRKRGNRRGDARVYPRKGDDRRRGWRSRSDALLVVLQVRSKRRAS